MTIVSKKPRKVEEAQQPPKEPDLSATVLNNVLFLLGKPKDLSQISGSLTRATKITHNSFRINIYRDIPFATLTDTFYVKVDGLGDIISSNPKIEKKYA